MGVGLRVEDFVRAGSAFRISDSEFGDSGFGFRVPGFGFRVWNFGARITRHRLVSGIGIRGSESGFRES